MQKDTNRIIKIKSEKYVKHVKNVFMMCKNLKPVPSYNFVKIII